MRIPPVVAVVGVAVVLLLLFGPLPDLGRLGHELGNAAHFPVGALFALGLRHVLVHGKRKVKAPGGTALVLTVALLLAVEVIQPLFGRSFSFGDWIVGFWGALAGLSFLAVFRGPALERVVSAVLCLFFVVMGAAQVARPLYDTWRQQRDFPLLASFEDELELSRWSFDEVYDEHVAALVPTHGESHLALTFLIAPYPAATFQWPPPDWRGYATLALDVHLFDDEPYELILKVTDADHDDSYEDRFHAYLTLEPGLNEVRIPLADVAAGPKHRRLDLGRVRSIQLFADHPDRAAMLGVDHLRLER